MTRSRAWVLAVALLAWAGHLALLFYFVAPKVIFSDAPIDGADYDTHIGQTLRVVDGLETWGQPWVYDVQLLAGQPEGTIFDADNKGWEAWTFMMWKLGLSKGMAFNSFVLATHALLPVIVACAAWLFELGAWAALLAGVMGSTLWFFDSWMRWGWWIGMVSYETASVAFLVPLGLFYRFTVRSQNGAGLAFIPALALCHLVHPYSFFMLVVPLCVMYLRARKTLRRSGHAIVVLAGVATLALNGFWLLAAIHHWHYILDSAFFGRTGVGALVADFFNVWRDPSDTGVIGTRAGFRFLYLGMSLAAQVAWVRTGDARRFAFGSAFSALFVLGYLGSYLPGVAQIQPYRHVLPLSFVACIGAAAFVEQLVVSRAFATLQSGMRALLVVFGLGAAQHLAGDVIYFIPDALPAVAPMINGTPPPFAATGYPPVLPYRFPRRVDAVLRIAEIAEWVTRNVTPGDRVLIEDTHLGERVAWRTRAEVLGGFRQRNIAHAYANFFRHFADRMATHAELESYLRTYAVRWVIADTLRSDFEGARDLLEARGTVEGRYVYRTAVPVDKVLAGGGTVQARTNLIEVHGSDPHHPLVLSYHFHERLVCLPQCSVQREPSPFDSVGLIRVAAPHPPDVVLAIRY